MARRARGVRAPLRFRPAFGLVVGIAAAGLWLHPGVAAAFPEYAAGTGKDCSYCHVTPGGPLTEAGQAFKDNGYALPTETTAAPPTTAATETTTPTQTTAGSATTAPPGGAGGPATPTTVDTPTTVSPEAGGSNPGSPAASGPILELPRWVRTLLLWAHLVAVVAWLGAIVFVHVVQTPKVAGRGIPRGYLNLAWPSIAVVGVSGLFLTLGTVTGLGTLTEGRWGRLLLTKIAMYLFLAGIALLATFVISPRLRRVSAADLSSGGDQEQFRARGRTTFAHQGRVYDVTDSHLWREGRHAKRHQAWTDLTAALGGAPHGPEVFERFPMVSGGEAPRVPAVARLFVVVAYVNLFMVLAVLLVVAAW